jgi:hypothetical protein
MKSYYAKISDIIEGKVESPLPIDVIPNNMGINICSVDAISWQKQDDGQLVNLSIHFLSE